MSESKGELSAVAVDLVVITLERDELAVVLVRRGIEPFLGAWALPGGFRLSGESLDEAARRELLEETGIDRAGELLQFGAYGDPGRDPRGDVVSIGYAIATAPSTLREIRAGGDAAAVACVPLEAIRSGKVTLAFDHAAILEAAVDALAVRLEHTGLAPRFLDEPFTLTELRRVYERFWDEELNAANFRRALLPKAPVPADNADGMGVLRMRFRQFEELPRLDLFKMNSTVRDADRRLATVRELVERGSIDGVEQLLWNQVDTSGAIPYLSVVSGSEQGGRGDRYRATVAWDLQPPPIRRPRRRSRADREGGGDEW